MLVGIDSRGSGIEPTQYGSPAGAANRGGTMSVGKGCPAGCKAVQIRSVNFAGVAIKEADPVVQVIDRQKKNILPGFRRSGLCKHMSRNKKEKYCKKFYHRGQVTIKG